MPGEDEAALDTAPEAAGADPGVPYGPPAPRRRRGLRALLPSPVWHVGRLLILALILEYLVLPQLAGPRKVGRLLTQVNPFLLLAGVGLEAGALLSYAMLTRAVLPNSNRVKFFTIFRIQLSTLSVSHCAPGGSAAGTALGYRLMTQAGIRPGDAGFALGMQGIGSAVVLNVILWIALIVSIPVWGFAAVYLLAAMVGAVLLAASVALLYAFTRGEDRVAELLERAAGRIPFIDGAVLRRSFVELASRLEQLGRERQTLIHAVVWASLNWVLDAASLAVMVGAFGHWVNPDGLLVAYGLANVLAVIPITPGGLGVIEATLTTLLVGFGTPQGVATLGVVVYRFINFWLPIPVGGLAYLSLQVDRTAERHRPRGWRWPIPGVRRDARLMADLPGPPRPEELSKNSREGDAGRSYC
ncbi:MAG: flippase-like domain-containing protein [Acidimicrobiales bacterium]|nr:flippase-like domain-containing protein [Acidimicrobiales bacterium]